MTGFINKPFTDDELFAMLEEKLGDIFTYSDQTMAEGVKAEPVSVSLTPESMTAIPQDLINKMRSATVNAQFDQLMNLIDKVSSYSPQIANKLRELTDNYQYDSLLNLFKEG
jgi:hypothetical protein